MRKPFCGSTIARGILPLSIATESRQVSRQIRDRNRDRSTDGFSELVSTCDNLRHQLAPTCATHLRHVYANQVFDAKPEAAP
jgi:hypothetical protein